MPFKWKNFFELPKFDIDCFNCFDQDNALVIQRIVINSSVNFRLVTKELGDAPLEDIIKSKKYA